MAVNDRTLRAAGRMRARLNAHVDQATTDLVTAWVKAWDDLAAQWDAAIADLIAYQQTHDGAWPPAWRIARAERAQRALLATRTALDALAARTGTTITEALPTLTAEAAAWQAQLIATQMPPAALAGELAVAATFNRVDETALQAIVERTTEQVTALTWPLAGEATAAMNRHLVRGIALGDNPRTVAARMLRNLETGFNGGLTRALTIARTEMLDAHRVASRAQRMANTDVLAGWQWQATLDRRTCPSCLAKHGQQFPVDEQGPNDHQNGRCAALPVTKSWRDLGFDLDEPTSTLPDARAWFNALPEKDQLAVMGRTRLTLLRTGRIGWGDLTTRRTTPGWRDSWHVAPVRGMPSSGVARRPATPSTPGPSTRTAKPAPSAPGKRVTDFRTAFNPETIGQVANDMLEEVNAAWEGTGYSAIQRSATPTRNKASLVYTILGPDGTGVGTLWRDVTDGGAEIHNELFTLDPEHQGKGLATLVAPRLEAWYARSGVKRVTVHANIDVGGYTWARQGFGWDESLMEGDDVRALIRSVGYAAGERPRSGDWHEGSVLKEWEDAVKNNPDDPAAWPSPFDLSQYGRNLGDQQWPGREGLLYRDWYGAKDL